MYSRGRSDAKKVLTDQCWRSAIEAFDEALVVVEIPKFLESLVEDFDVREGVDL